ncbi:hypothetical protein GGU10DRAFT_382585 [Lentinula aff. detonsa]|uniref:Secreted protein n=1 Tax=Lentinula aff. detonsa TaxID=2804958 RepID=A0AA38NAV5_9AGAR|nr:hypothetical protein GGU10DRAFT_382585 [Lentinula aff. detonsa]
MFAKVGVLLAALPAVFSLSLDEWSRIKRYLDCYRRRFYSVALRPTAKHSRIRLPRSTNATASSSRTKSYVTQQVVALVKAASTEPGVPPNKKRMRLI